jgi:transcriptional antiterminator NusG
MKNWIILFVRTGSEEKLMDALKEDLNAEEFLPFVPSKETTFRNKGVVHVIRKPLFPGYIFVQTEIKPDLIADKLEAVLADIGKNEQIYTILHYGDDKKDVAIREEERLHWARLFNDDFCVRGSIGFIVGDTVQIISGALMGMESRIKRINRRKREAVVEMHIMGAAREVSLMLEVVEKK